MRKEILRTVIAWVTGAATGIGTALLATHYQKGVESDAMAAAVSMEMKKNINTIQSASKFKFYACGVSHNVRLVQLYDSAMAQYMSSGIVFSGAGSANRMYDFRYSVIESNKYVDILLQWMSGGSPEAGCSYVSAAAEKLNMNHEYIAGGQIGIASFGVSR